MATQVLLTADRLDEKLTEMAEALAAMVEGPDRVALIGIRTRGALMAERLQGIIKDRKGWELPLGILDITLYRDDLSQLASNPLVHHTQLEFDVTGKTILLIDDVLYTGRTARSALAEIVDFGRPRAIRLAVLVDRGGREYPIQADYASLRLDVDEHQLVKVCMEEVDGANQVLLGDIHVLRSRPAP